PVAEMNITPLVDVMLVLLVIFMVSAPALTGRLDMLLPRVTPETPVTIPPKITLHITEDGRFDLDGRMLSARELVPALQAVSAQAPNTLLHLDANEQADYQAFTHAISAARESGLNLSLD